MIISSGIFIFNDIGELLICHPTGGSFNVNWSIPKGKQESDETILQTAIRETYEECNVNLHDDSEQVIYISSQIYKTNKKLIHGHYYKLISDDIDLKCNSVIPNYMDNGKLRWNGGKLENDILKFVSVDYAMSVLHEAQQKILKIIHQTLL